MIQYLHHRNRPGGLAALLLLAAVFPLLLPGSARSQGPTEAPPPDTTAAAPGPTAPRYTGEKISLNLKDVDLKDFFRLIHQVSGLNIVVDSNVTGTVTVALDDVPWDQALGVVLMNNGLDKTLEGNVLRVSRLETLSAQAESRAKLVQAEAASSQLVTVVRYLKFASAADVMLNNTNSGANATGSGTQVQSSVTGLQSIPGVAAILRSMAPSIFTRRGSVVADPRNNAVIITDVGSQIPVIQGVIDKLDHKARQISIEAKIVLTTNDFNRQLQTALNAGLANRSGSTTMGGATGSGASSSAPPVTLSQTTVAGFGTYALSNVGARYFIGAAIAAAETRNEAKVISAPTIVTQNNIPASVVQGTQIPVQTTGQLGLVTTQYIAAALILQVTPQVTDDGHIFLNILVANNSPGPVLPGTSSPEINTQSATTQVLVPDGGVVIFGGIKVTSNTKSATQVPGLGSIPVLGNLFKSSQREEKQNELLFIVTPKILPT
ncbi:MAG TPA: type IV pilus secretin PilQ [Terriglobia bacterium]|nr:type IV pilus secretin PilQ [Terriglobia bacterium]